MLRALLLGVLAVSALASCKSKGDAPSVAVGKPAGKVIEISGKVEATREGKTRELAMGAEVYADDQVATSADATVTIELFHNSAKWAVVSNKKQRVDASLAWGLDKQQATKAVDESSAAAGRNAERSAADTASTAADKNVAPPAEPAAVSQGAPIAPKAPSAGASGGKGAPAATGAAAPGGGSPPPPPPPPPPKIESKSADRMDTNTKSSTATKAAPRTTESMPRPASAPDVMGDDAAPEKMKVVITPQELAEKSRDDFKKCLADASNTMTITLSGGKPKITFASKVTGKTQTCVDAVAKKIDWPKVTAKLTLKF